MSAPAPVMSAHAPRRVLLATSSRRCAVLPTLLDGPGVTAPAALDVLFLEDTDLLGLAALPFSREVGLASGIARDLSRQDIEHALARAARQVDADARTLAQRLRSSYRFQVTRGRREEEIPRRAAAADLALVEPRRERSRSLPAQVVVAVDSDLAAAERALHTAYLLAGRHWARVTVIVPASAGTTLREDVIHLTRVLGRTAETPRLRQGAATNREDVLTELASLRADAMVLPLAMGNDNAPLWARWIATRDCLLALLS
jgi:hypothetical protein